MVPITATPASFIPVCVSLCQPPFLKVCIINSMLASSCLSWGREMLSPLRWIRLPRKHFVDYVSHKGDRGHDSAEPVSSVGGGGAKSLAGDPGSAACSPWARAEGISGSFLEGRRGKGGASQPHRAGLSAAKAAQPQLAPNGGAAEKREMGSLELPQYYHSQTEILHFQAVKNVKFPCSGLESHHRPVGTLAIAANQTSVGSCDVSD